MKENIYKISIESETFNKKFLSIDNVFSKVNLFGSQQPEEFYNAIILNIGREAFDNLKKNNIVNISIDIVDEKSLKYIEWISNEDITRFVDITYNMKFKTKYGEIRDLTKIGLKMQFFGLAITLLSIIFMKNFPFEYYYAPMILFISFLFFSPIIMQLSFNRLKKQVISAFNDVFINIDDNESDLKLKLNEFQTFIKSRYKFSYLNLCEFQKKTNTQ